MLSHHDYNSSDPYLRPVFPFLDKLRRHCWSATWVLLCKWTPNPMHIWRISILRLFGAKIGQKNFIYPTCKIWAPWLLETGDVVAIGPGVEIYNPGGARLGHHSVISQHAFLCGATHDYNSDQFTYIKKEIVLEPYVWICAKAIILPGVHCMEGSVLGAATVTSRNLEQWTVYAGNPARPVKKRQKFSIKQPEVNANVISRYLINGGPV
jgi:putative colanic acid biosynthesis acetyltransferase WcaF